MLKRIVDIDKLLQKLLEEFADLDIFSQESTTFFVVYAHDVPNGGKADAAIVRQLIAWFKALRAKVLSDQSLRPEFCSTRDERVVHDILSNQFCLLPKTKNPRSSENASRVDKVILCCSEVLQGYHEDVRMISYHQALKNVCVGIEGWKSTHELERGIEEVVKEHLEKEGFHHVLTEMAFLDVRSVHAEKCHQDHGIIPVVLSGDGIKTLPFFDRGVPLWLKLQRQSKSMIHECQASHRLFFNLLRHLYTDLEKEIGEIEECYGKCVKNLERGLGSPWNESFDQAIQKEILRTQQQLIKYKNAKWRSRLLSTPLPKWTQLTLNHSKSNTSSSRNIWRTRPW